MLSAKIWRFKKCKKYPPHQMIRLCCLEVHITISNPNIDVNPRSGLLRCHRYSILIISLNLTLNKMKYAKPNC